MSTRSVIIRLEAEVAGYVAGMGRAAQATDSVARQVVMSRRAMDDNRDAMDKVGKTMMGFGTISVAALGASAKAAMDWESAWAGVTKTVSGTPAQMDELESSLRNMAKTLPATHEEIAGVAEAAGQLGVKREDIAKFTKTMIDLGTSTNLTADEAATGIAQIANVMGTSGDEIDNFGAALVALGNDGASTEKDILSMAQRIAGAGKLVGASESDVLALSNTLASMGVKAELGGGVATRALLKMYAAVQEGGPKLEAFSKTAGVSAADFSKAFSESPVKALGMVTAGMERTKAEGGNVVAALKDMGMKGTEEMQVMLSLAGAGDLLNRSLALGDSAWKSNTALVNEASKRYETTESKVKIAWNNIKDAAIDAGAVLLPIIQGVAESVSSLAAVFGDLPEPVQGIIVSFAGILGVAALVGGGMLTLIPKIAATRAAFATLNTAGSRIPATFGKIAKVGALVAGLGLVVTALAKVAEADYMSKIDQGMGKVNEALARTANQTPRAAEGLDGLFKDRDGGDLINTVDGLDSALKRTFQRDGGQQFNDWGEAVVNGMTGVKGSSQILNDAFGRLDDGLSELVSSGNAEGAAKSFDLIKQAADRQGIGVDELITKFPHYADALKQAEADATAAGKGGDNAAGGIKAAGTAAETAAEQVAEITKSLDDMGVGIDGSIIDLVKFTDALLNAGLMQLSARDAARGFQEAIDKVGESAKENGTSLDINTEKGRANQAALDGVAAAGYRVIEANAKNGEGQEVLQKNLSDTHQALLDSAKQFGITGDEAEALTRDVMKIPPGVNIDTWMADTAKKMAEGTKKALEDLDGKTIHTYSIEHVIKEISTQVKGGGSEGDPSMTALDPGSLSRRAGGGDLDSAPGPKGVDSQLFFGAKGEHVLTAQEVDMMGGQDAVYRFRAQVRQGQVPSYAGGGSLGALASSRNISSGNPVGAPSVSLEGLTVVVTNPFTGEQVQGIVHTAARQAAGSVLTKADGNARYMRKGRA